MEQAAPITLLGELFFHVMFWFPNKIKTIYIQPNSEIFPSHDWWHGLHMPVIKRTWAPHFNKSTRNLYFLKVASQHAERGLLFLGRRYHMFLCNCHCRCGPKHHNIISTLEENNLSMTCLIWIQQNFIFTHVNLEICLASYSGMGMSAFIKDIPTTERENPEGGEADGSPW